jgi:hypothetical protein
MKNNKTELQKKFEEQTPTILNPSIGTIEYLQCFVTWLHLQLETPKPNLSAEELINPYEFLDEYVSSMYLNCSSLHELIDGFGVRKDGAKKKLYEVIKEGLDKYVLQAQSKQNYLIRKKLPKTKVRGCKVRKNIIGQ